MNSLVLVSYSPRSAAGGAPLRNRQTIHALSSLGPVDLISIGVEGPPEPVKDIRDWACFPLEASSGWRRTLGKGWAFLPGRYPLVDGYRSEAVARAIRTWTSERRYDVAVLETIVVTSYARMLKGLGCRVVYDAHNAEAWLHESLRAAARTGPANVGQRIKDGVVLRRLRRVEAAAVRGADVVWTCSETDAKELTRAYRPPSGIHVVPNGVDVCAYHRPDAPPVDVDWTSSPITMVYPGSFAYPPNAAAAIRLMTDVLGAVRTRGFEARVVLVGREPGAALLAAAARDRDVHVTGAVESVLPYLEQPCVVTLPIDGGSGTRLKILEAFAIGRPVVSTVKGAEGIDAVDGVHLLIRHDARAIADAVIQTWHRRDLRAQLCANALDLVRQRYSWSAATEAIAACLGAPGRPRSLPTPRAQPVRGHDVFH